MSPAFFKESMRGFCDCSREAILVFLRGWCMHIYYFHYEPGLEPDILARLSVILSRIRCPMSMLCSTMVQSLLM